QARVRGGARSRERVVEADRIGRVRGVEPAGEVHLVALARPEQLVDACARGRVVDSIEAAVELIGRRRARRGTRLADLRLLDGHTERSVADDFYEPVVVQDDAIVVAREHDVGDLEIVAGSSVHALDRAAEVVRTGADPESARVDLA